MSSNDNDLQNIGHSEYLPYSGNNIGLTHVNDTSVITNNSPVVKDTQIIVTENAGVDDANLSITIEKEDNDIEYLEVDIWTGSSGIVVDGINSNPDGTIDTQTVMTSPDPEGQFDDVVPDLITNDEADISGTSISLGQFDAQTRFLNRNAYKTLLRKMKYKDTPENFSLLLVFTETRHSNRHILCTHW